MNSSSEKRRVVLTGVGIVSPLGLCRKTLWESLLSGTSGVRAFNAPWAEVLNIAVASPADQFEGKIDDFGTLQKGTRKALRKGLKVMCRECQMGVAAAQMALVDAGLSPGSHDPTRAGISFGSDYMITLPDEFIEGMRQCINGLDGSNGLNRINGSSETCDPNQSNGSNRFDFSRWATEGMPRMSPLWLLKYLPNMPASHLAIYNDFRGPNNSITIREASGNLALAEATEIIRRGRADIMLCGATGTRLNPTKMIHAVQQEQVAPGRPIACETSRPFDRDRQGMVLGEGAAAMVLEDWGSAQARGATILGEVVSGASCSAIDRTLDARNGQAIRQVLKTLLKRSDTLPDQIGHLHAHGLSTQKSDSVEAGAISDIFSQRRRAIPVVALKSFCGNLGAGSGLIELAASLSALEHGHLFPTINYNRPDPSCPISVVTDPTTPSGDSFINLSVTPQAQASALLIRRFE